MRGVRAKALVAGLAVALVATALSAATVAFAPPAAAGPVFVTSNGTGFDLAGLPGRLLGLELGRYEWLHGECDDYQNSAPAVFTINGNPCDPA